MAWVAIPNNTQYQYDNDPPDPNDLIPVEDQGLYDHPWRDLWLLQTAGIRTWTSPVTAVTIEYYTRTRRWDNEASDWETLPDSADYSRGEISKTYWDAH